MLTFLDPPTNLTDLAAVTGAGVTACDVSARFTTSGTTSTIGAVLAFGGSANANLGLSVAYTYTPADPVPEPVSMLLLGSELIGFYAVRRRRAGKFVLLPPERFLRPDGE